VDWKRAHLFYAMNDPEIRVIIYDSGEVDTALTDDDIDFGGVVIWSFHAAEVDPSAYATGWATLDPDTGKYIVDATGERLSQSQMVWLSINHRDHSALYQEWIDAALRKHDEAKRA